jgi:hypothetical protein
MVTLGMRNRGQPLAFILSQVNSPSQEKFLIVSFWAFLARRGMGMAPNGKNNLTVAEWRELFDAFYKRHQDATGRNLQFTAFFNPALEAMIDSPILCMEARALAWIIRHAWGNSSDFAVDKPGGRPLGQKDFVARVGIDKRRASETFNDLEAEFFLETVERQLYPIDNPAAAAAKANEAAKSFKSDQQSGTSRTFSQWCEEEWKVRYVADFQELEAIEVRRRQINLVRLRLWRESVSASKNGGVLNLKELICNEKPNSSSSSISRPPVVEGPPTPKAEEEDGSLYQKFKTQYPPHRFDEGKVKPAFENLTKTQQARVIERLEVYLKSERWQRSIQENQGQYIPFASKWLDHYESNPPPYFSPQRPSSGDREYTPAEREEMERFIEAEIEKERETRAKWKTRNKTTAD